MDEENVQAQEEIVEQEENISEETFENTDSQEEETDDVTLSKSEFKKLQRKAIAYDATKELKEVKPKVQEKTEDNSVNVKLERLELRADGYTPDEIEAIMDLGGSKALKNPVVQSAIKAMRAEKKSQDTKEPLNSKSPVFKKFTQQDLSKMSASEMEKVLSE